jgi:hypothetical protein
MSLWYLLADAVGGLFSGGADKPSPYTEHPLSITQETREDSGVETAPSSAWDPAPITPEPWFDWKRHGRVLKLIVQILFVLLAIWLRYWFKQR